MPREPQAVLFWVVTTVITIAMLAALNATTIPVDTKKMNGATVLGVGTSGDKWRG